MTQLPDRLLELALTRREFLTGTTALGGMALASGLAFPNALRAAAESQRPVALTQAEWELTNALCARLIPGDEKDPGAREANCVNFIDKALANEDKALLPLYQHGLRGVDVAANALSGRTFLRLESIDQDRLLTQLFSDTAVAWPALPFSGSMFLEVARVHTIVGFLADPKYGGNAGFAGWSLLGYPGAGRKRGGFSPGQMVGEEAIVPAWGPTAPSGAGEKVESSTRP